VPGGRSIPIRWRSICPLDPGCGIALRRWLISLGSAIGIKAPEALDKLALEQQRHLS
jgi:hypothetical protein